MDSELLIKVRNKESECNIIRERERERERERRKNLKECLRPNEDIERFQKKKERERRKASEREAEGPKDAAENHKNACDEKPLPPRASDCGDGNENEKV